MREDHPNSVGLAKNLFHGLNIRYHLITLLFPVVKTLSKAFDMVELTKNLHYLLG